MDLLERMRSPWGESVFVHISWDLFWASLVGGLLFLLAHGGYMLFSQHRKRNADEVNRLEAERAGLPARILRHGFVARVFHWVMAFSMLVLLFTAFLPIIGVRFAWVQWHWMAGILLTASILFHIVHATFFLDFWSIWVGPKDIPEFKAEMLREIGKEDEPGPRPGKYPLSNRLYHLAVVVAGLGAYLVLGRGGQTSGEPPMVRIDTVHVRDTAAVPAPSPASPRATNPPPRERVAAPPAAAPGYITVNAEPYGELYIDGVDVGPTPVVRYAVPAGVHTIKVVREGYKSIVEKVQVDAGNTVPKRYTLLPGG